MGSFITETWLREHFSLAHGTEVRLPEDGRLTPAARTLLDEKRISIKYLDAAGRTFIESTGGAEGKPPSRQRVHPLTGSAEHPVATCTLCGNEVSRKPDAMTHLDPHHLTGKNHPRLRLRAKLDTSIAHAVWVQAELSDVERASTLSFWLADVRSCLGNVLRGEVTGEAVSGVRMGELDEEAIHRLSHDPLRYFGHDHLVPDASQGITVARLNLLRALIRETEVIAADVYIDRDYKLTRPDILQALNRLSSAVYLLMLLAYVARTGHEPDPERMAKWT